MNALSCSKSVNDVSHIQRVAQLDQIVICHPSFRRALSGITDCVEKSLHYRQAVGSLLLAEPGMGKTTLCNVFLKRMPSFVRTESQLQTNISPALYAEIPSPATVKSVASTLLARVGDPNSSVGSCTEMTKRLCHLLNKCETKLIFLDELHNLFDVRKSSTRMNALVCNWLKSLVNQTKISFCLVGLPQFANILLSDEQLNRRFPQQYHFRALTLGNGTTEGTLQTFLKEVAGASLPHAGITYPSSFDDLHLVKQIYAATHGSPAYVMDLLKDSALVALQDGRDSVSAADFSLARDMKIANTIGLSKLNPFEMGPGPLASFTRNSK